MAEGFRLRTQGKLKVMRSQVRNCCIAPMSLIAVGLCGIRWIFILLCPGRMLYTAITLGEERGCEEVPKHIARSFTLSCLVLLERLKFHTCKTCYE